MKKRMIILILVTLLFLPIIKLKAGYMDSYISWTLDQNIFAHKVQNGQHIVNNLAIMTADNKIAYCIEPGITADKNSYYSSTTNINDTKLSNINTKRLSLIGYYGYGYKGHEIKEYYMAAQELIWRQMGVEIVYWSTDKEGNNIINIDYYKEQILNLVNNYETIPIFNFKSKYVVGDEIILEDNNNVLTDYELSNYNNNVSIDGNRIKIKIIDGDNSFNLQRKNNGSITKFYYKDGYQTIGSFEFPYEHSASYNLNYTYGKIIVNKLDSNTKSKTLSSKYASLKDAEYGLYDSNNKLIKKGKTNEAGYVIFDELPKGNYMIKELSPSTGYTISKTVTRTFVSTNTLEVDIKSYEDIIKNKVVITKILDDEESKTCIYEQGIRFGIYDEEGNLLKEEQTDENGNITIELVFGKYILKQLSSPDGIDKVKDQVIEVKDDGKNQNIILINHRIKKEVIEEPKINQENNIEIQVLPKTGKNIYWMIIMFIISFIGIFVNEKNNYQVN